MKGKNIPEPPIAEPPIVRRRDVKPEDPPSVEPQASSSEVREPNSLSKCASNYGSMGEMERILAKQPSDDGRPGGYGSVMPQTGADFDSSQVFCDKLSSQSPRRIETSSSRNDVSTSTMLAERPAETKKAKGLPIYQWPWWALARTWDFASLIVLLAVVAVVPVVQLASLGYILMAAGNLASRKPWCSALPGLRLAGKLGTFALLATLLWLPVWLVTDLAYSAQLLQPNSSTALGWRIASFLITGIWIVHLFWAAMRGGRWWHLWWPAPLKFFKTAWRPSTWAEASDRLYELTARLQFPQLWWLGARAALGALLWITLPVSMMIIGQRAENFGLAGVIGFLGALLMIVIMLYLPYLQIQLASTNRFSAMFNILSVRKRFLFGPIAHAVAMLLLVALCIPLYLLRIEATPEELVWAPALVFVLFMLPAKIFLGAAMGYADGRAQRHLKIRHWSWRWPSRMLGFASVLIYVGALYVAQLVTSQGAFVMYFQHAFLVPVPLT